MSGLTLTTLHCVSGAVIHGPVFRGRGAQLQGELVLGRVYGDGGSTLEGGAVVSEPLLCLYPIHSSAFPGGCRIQPQ